MVTATAGMESCREDFNENVDKHHDYDPRIDPKKVQKYHLQNDVTSSHFLRCA